LEADPRFKDDEKFILEQVAPAMLNELLREFPLLLSEGIDYKATRDAMQKAQEESRHLWQFAREIGLEARAGGRVYIKDLWELLQKWYVETGTLEIDEGSNVKSKLIWHDLPNKYDTPVKAINQVFARFSEIFPKIQKLRHTEGGSVDPLKGQFYLSGIVQTSSTLPLNIASLASLAQCDGDTASLTASLDLASEAVSEARTLSDKRSEASEAIFSPFAEVCKLVAKFTEAERQKLIELLTQPQPLPAPVTAAEFAEQIRTAIAKVDKELANQILKVLKGKAQEKLREEVKSHLTYRENENFRLLVVAGFLLDMPVKYVGPKYAEQYEGLELQVYKMDEHFQITCRKPDGYLTTRMKPEELEKL
jgi:hypothetical protein